MYLFSKMQRLATCRTSLQTNTGQHTAMVTTSNRSVYALLLLFLAVATSCCYLGWSVSRVASGPRPIDCWCLHCRQWTIFTWCPFSSGITLRMGYSAAGNMSCCCVPGCRSHKSDNEFSFHHSLIDQQLKAKAKAKAMDSKNLEGFSSRTTHSIAY